MPIDPVIGGALIKGIGGLFGQKKKNPTITTAQGVVGQAFGAREASRLHGFNPLTMLGVSAPMQDTSGSAAGSLIADGIATVADAWSQSAADKAEAQRVAEENEELRKKVMNDTIRPQMPGLFQTPQSVQAPSMGPTRNPRPSTGAGGRGPSGMTTTPPEAGRVDGKNPANFFDLVTDGADPTFTESASDVAKAVPVVPYFWGGQWFTPHPGYPDASFVEEYFGDEGPGAMAMNWQQGIDKAYYHVSQTPLGMVMEGYKRGDYERIARAKKWEQDRKDAENSNGGEVPSDWWKHQFRVTQ